MKKVYLIRHGESEANALKFEASDDTPLSELGKEQTQFLGERFSNINIDKIISSTYTRALHTAEAIASKKDLAIEQSALFIERRVPTEVIGLSLESEELKKVFTILKENFTVPGKYYSDEESFDDMKNRAAKALEFLESLEANSIVVTTHALFLTMLVTYMTFGDSVTPRDFLKIFNTFKKFNTGITVCEFYPQEKTDEHTGWRLLVWNDRAHLGEV